MNDNELNFNSESSSDGNGGDEMNLSIFRFDIRSLAIWLLLKWRWIAVVFFAAIVVFWSIFKYQKEYSFDAWTAEAKVLHQTRSDTLPSFYKPSNTNTVLQFMSSQNAISRAANRIKSNPTYTFSQTMLSNVEISANKTKNNVISIFASASTPQTAAAMANAIAEEGIAEYVRNQNNSVRTVKEERERQRSEVDREIASIEAQKKLLHSKDSGLPPDMEFQKKRTELATLVSGKSESLLNVQKFETRIKNLEKLLKDTPQKVEYETIVDKASKFGLKQKESEFNNIAKRYTPENPKYKVALEELEEMRIMAKQAEAEQSRVSFRINDIYVNLSQQLANLRLDRDSEMAAITQYDGEIEKKRSEIHVLTDAFDEYSILTKRTDMLKNKSIKLSDTISELDFLMSSAVPDVYIFEAAKEPTSSNISKTRLKVATFSLVTTFLFVFLLAAVKIGRMKIMSAREYKISLGLEVLGEVPEGKQYSEEIHMAALQKVARNLRANLADGKNIAVLKFDDNGEMDSDILELLNICAMNGIKSFRLNCMPISSKSGNENSIPSKDDDVAQTLVGVQKFADNGIFYHQNNYTIDVAEKDLLEFDLKILGLYYDIIVIELNCSEDSGQLSSQISKLVNFVTLSAPFEMVSKFTLQTNIDQIREVGDVKIGGILTNVPKPYYTK